MTSWRGLFAVGFFFAFSPTWVDLLKHGIAHPEAGVSLVFPWLAWIAWRGEARPGRRIRWGWIALSVGLLIQLAAVAGDVVRLGRVGLALGLIGLAVGTGWSSFNVAFVSLWTIPVPHFLVALASPSLESIWAQLASGLLQLLGIGIEGDGQKLVGPAGSLELQPSDGGMAVVVMLAGVVWFSLVRDSRAEIAMIPRCFALALVGLPLQWTAIVLAALGLGLGGDPEWLRYGLSGFPWLLIWGVAFGLVWMKREPRRLEEAAR